MSGRLRLKSPVVASGWIDCSRHSGHDDGPLNLTGSVLERVGGVTY